ncbi:MAG: hypothetical protein KUG71_02065 [Porticoccaceae bacterium]|nr:hypothetical protein [Porticoccaceae bacterium]
MFHGELAIGIESLIPFGLHQASGELVDVASVPRGRECGCICPSCETPLVARHGKQKEWHFAHRSRSVHSETKRECEYSFLVSVRLMIRQLSMNGLRFQTPDFIEELEVYSDVSHQAHSVKFTIAGESEIELESSSVGATFSNVEVDVLGNVKSVPFAIYCTYQGRDIPESLCNPETRLCGVVELSLAGVAHRFRQEKYGRYIDALRSYIEESSEGKFWAYHPRYEAARKQAEVEAALWLSEQKAPVQTKNRLRAVALDAPISNLEPLPLPKREAKSYKCVMCGERWFGSSRECQPCNTHIFTTECGEI